MKKVIILRCFHNPGTRNAAFGDSRLPHKNYAMKVAEGEYGGRWHVEHFRYFSGELSLDNLRGIPFSKVYFEPDFPPALERAIRTIVDAYADRHA